MIFRLPIRSLNISYKGHIFILFFFTMPVTTKTASHSANKFLESSLCNDVQDFFSVDTSFHLFAKELLASNFQSRDNVKQSFQSLKNTCLVNNPSSAGLIPRVGSHATTGF